MTSIGRSVRGWLALAAFLGGLSLPFASARHFWGVDDPACDQATVFGLKTAASYTTATPAPAPGHCTICHWQRAVGGATTASTQSVVAWVIPFDAPRFAAAPFVPSVVLSNRPSRAPPQAFVS